jgi:glutamate-5-semialdehyde dehydrogenase
MNAKQAIKEKALAAESASIALAAVSEADKNAALALIADALKGQTERIVRANTRDLDAADASGLPRPLLKRLVLDGKKILRLCDGIAGLISLEAGTGKVLLCVELDDGLELRKVRCPIGVVAVIFESRPDALVQISCLCLKSGNAVLLKGGSEARHTNAALAGVIAEAASRAPVPAGWLQLLEDRRDVEALLSLDAHVDLVIPRGSNEFVRHIMDNTKIPVLGHADGICSVYVDAGADLKMAVEITVDSKCQYPAVCNAAETLLVDGAIAADFLPPVAKALREKGVRLAGCAGTAAIIDVEPATDRHWKTEYLDLAMSIRVVDGLEAAIDHINRYGSGHTDAIVTNDQARAERFMEMVDSANVFWNCSTRFSDGFRYGLGAEVGISTNKIHARGPVGLEGLSIYKWKLYGRGQTVADYADGAKTFKHRPIHP